MESEVCERGSVPWATNPVSTVSAGVVLEKGAPCSFALSCQPMASSISTVGVVLL